MAKKTKKRRIDPDTGKQLPIGVEYRGPEQYRASYMVEGERGADTFKTAIDARDWREQQIFIFGGGGNLPLRKILKRWTVKMLIDFYLKEHLNGIRSRDGHLSVIENSFFYNYTLAKLTDDDVIKWKKAQEKVLAKSTVVRRINLLSAIFNYGIRNLPGRPLRNWLNPANSDHVERPKNADVKRTRTLTKEEYIILMEALREAGRPDDTMLTQFAIFQATRLSEAVRLTWGDISFERSVMYVQKTKVDKYRQEAGPQERPLTQVSLSILESQREAYRKAKGEYPSKDNPVFDVGNAQAFSTRFGRIKNALKKDGHGFVNFRFHDLKHDSITRLAEYIEYQDLRFFTGHLSNRMLERYHNPSPETLANKYKNKA